MPAGPRVLRVSIAAAAVLAVAGCGSSSSSSSSTSATAAKQATVAALTKATTTSLRYSLDGSFTIDTSKLRNIPGDLMQGITSTLGNGLKLTASGEQESASRVQVAITLKPLLPGTVTAVVYDGTFYYSLDGKRFGSGGSIAAITGGFALTPNSTSKLFGSLPESAYSDRGQTQIDGTTVEHYSAQLTKDDIFGAVAGQPSPGSQAQKNLQQLTQFITSTSSTVDAYVRADNGQLARQTTDFNFGFDIGAIAGGLAGGSSAASGEPSGVLQLHLAITADFRDYGAAITIQKPKVDPNAPRLPAGITGLGGLL